MRSDSLGTWRDSEGRGWRGGEILSASATLCHMSPWGGCPGPQSAWILHPTASLPPAGSRARPAVPSSGATVAAGPPGVFGPECQSTGLMRVSTDLLQSLSLGIFRAPFRGSNAAPRQPGWHKASNPAFVYTWHDSSLPARILVHCPHTPHLQNYSSGHFLAWSLSLDSWVLHWTRVAGLRPVTRSPPPSSL